MSKTRAFFWIRFFAVIFNLLISGCWFFVPNFLYLDAKAALGEGFDSPYLEFTKPYFYIIGFVFLIMTLLYVYPRGRWLMIPTVLTGLLTLLLAYAQAGVFRHSISEGVLLTSFTVLPCLIATILAFRLYRLSSRRTSI